MAYDIGDAPSSYEAVDDIARHAIWPTSPYLGSLVGEPDAEDSDVSGYAALPGAPGSPSF